MSCWATALLLLLAVYASPHPLTPAECKIGRHRTGCASVGSCACAAACEQAYWSGRAPFCFNTSAPAVSTFTELLAAPRLLYTFQRPLQSGGRDVQFENAPPGSVYAGPPDDFSDPAACSFAGWKRTSGKCDCFSGFGGATCAEKTREWLSTPCLGGPCKNCSWGVCYDDKRSVRGVSRPYVYVYDLPPGLNALRPRVGMGDRNTAYELWRRLVLSSHYTTDASEADLFFLPVAPMGRVPHGVVLWAQAWASQALPYWNATQGRDHFVVCAFDFGCSGIAGFPQLRNLRFVSHWGLTAEDKRYSQPCPLCGPSYAPGKDAVIPDMIEAAAARRPRSAVPRTALLFFSGGPTSAVRKALFAATEGDADARMLHGHVGLAAEMDAARFCAAPPGAGFGSRGSLAVARGCIPVLLGDGIEQAYAGWLDWARFSVRIADADVNRTMQLLRAIPAGEEARLREEAERVAWMFVWDDSRERDAFTAVMEYLGHQLRPRLRPRPRSRTHKRRRRMAM